jgi:hypothetical protein
MDAESIQTSLPSFTGVRASRIFPLCHNQVVASDPGTQRPSAEDYERSRREGEAFCRQVVKAFPELAESFNEHIEDNFGEVLPHAFFGDVSRHVETLLDRKNQREGATRLGELMAFFEKSYGPDDDPVSNVIAVSFIEHLWDRSDLRPFLGPQMRAQFDRINGR